MGRIQEHTRILTRFTKTALIVATCLPILTLAKFQTDESGHCEDPVAGHERRQLPKLVSEKETFEFIRKYLEPRTPAPGFMLNVERPFRLYLKASWVSYGEKLGDANGAWSNNPLLDSIGPEWDRFLATMAANETFLKSSTAPHFQIENFTGRLCVDVTTTLREVWQTFLTPALPRAMNTPRALVQGWEVRATSFKLLDQAASH